MNYGNHSKFAIAWLKIGWLCHCSISEPNFVAEVNVKFPVMGLLKGVLYQKFSNLIKKKLRIMVLKFGVDKKTVYMFSKAL